MDMSLLVEIVSGASAGRRVAVPNGERLWVGRSERAQLTVPGSVLAARHFALSWTAEQGVLETRDGCDVQVNGERSDDRALAHGDWIRAGDVDFMVYRQGASFGADSAAVVAADAMRSAALATLRDHAGGDPDSGNLYAIVDAARDRRVRLLLAAAAERWQSLYQGSQAMTLAAAAPYLVALGPNSELLLELVAEGWGASWGIYFVSTQPFARAWRSARRLITIRVEGADERAYFRFYDPRVMRSFLPLATPRQRTSVFNALGRILLEDAARRLQLFEARVS